jgi:hypothetical protein
MYPGTNSSGQILAKFLKSCCRMKTWLYGRFAPGHLSHFFDAFGPKAKPFIFKAMRSWTNSSHHCKILGLQFNKKKLFSGDLL